MQLRKNLIPSAIHVYPDYVYAAHDRFRRNAQFANTTKFRRTIRTTEGEIDFLGMAASDAWPSDLGDSNSSEPGKMKMSDLSEGTQLKIAQEFVKNAIHKPYTYADPTATKRKFMYPPDSAEVSYVEREEKKIQMRKRFKDFDFHPKYEDFYLWFYDVVINLYRRDRRIKAHKNFTGTVDYDNLLKSTPYSIPTPFRRYYAYVKELERIYNIRNEDPPSVHSSMLDGEPKFFDQIIQVNSSEERKFLRKNSITRRIASWEDSSDTVKVQARGFMPEKYERKHRDFFYWLYVTLFTLHRRKKKANLMVNMNHMNLLDSNFDEEIKNTPFPIPERMISMYPYFKKLRLAYDGITKRYNDTHYTVVLTYTTPRIRKSTPYRIWKNRTAFTLFQWKNETMDPEDLLFHRLSSETFKTRPSGRNRSLITMGWVEKITAARRILMVKIARKKKHLTVPYQFPEFSPYYDWQRSALKYVGNHFDKFQINQKRTTRANISTPFPIPRRKMNFYQAMMLYMTQIKQKLEGEKTTSRWRD